MSTPSPRRGARSSSRSFSVEPKSDVLRSALEARRAKDSLDPTTPCPPEPNSIPKQPTSSKPASSASYSDPWLEQARSQDATPQVIPIPHRRRPSEGSPAHFPSQREKQADDATKNKLFGISLQNELLKKQNNELKDELDAAKKRIEGLEPLKDENIDLLHKSNGLTIDMQNMEDDIASLEEKIKYLNTRLRDSDAQNRELDERNTEILQIQEETLPIIENQRIALEEAADLILACENENEYLLKKIRKLEAKILNGRSSSSVASPSHYQDTLDGQAKERHPSRVHSIDDSRPSTSHFDSDYFSQTDSPQAKAHLQVKDQALKEKTSFSERARHQKFKDISLTSQKSMNDLNKRLSNISLKASNAAERAQTPDVRKTSRNHDSPYDEPQSAKPIDRGRTQHRQHRTPQQTASVNTAWPPSLTAAVASSPLAPINAAATGGLRSVYQDHQTIERTSSTLQSPTPSQGSLRSQGSIRRLDGSLRLRSETLPPTIVPPERSSSRRHVNRPPSGDEYKTRSTSSEYPGSLPPPSTASDFTSLPDEQGWWKETQKIRSNAGHSNDLGNNFLFNAAETEEDFMNKTRRGTSRR